MFRFGNSNNFIIFFFNDFLSINSYVYFFVIIIHIDFYDRTAI